MQSGKLLKVALVLATVPSAVLAHHGWSEYNSEQLLKLTGRIAESGYEHPHGYVKLETPGKTWNAVLAPPSRMEARGLSKDALKVGSQVSVEGYANRNKPEEMRAERISAGGKTVELR
jgi:hypothetical protein